MMLHHALALLLACAGTRFATEEAVIAEALARFDLDGDGAIDGQEYARFAPRAESFEDLDLDGDGAIDALEFATFLATASPRPEFGGRVRVRTRAPEELP
jgi:Ca2+-binding EF-hand superfamily protein